jgi:hypothetical protein
MLSRKNAEQDFNSRPAGRRHHVRLLAHVVLYGSFTLLAAFTLTGMACGYAGTVLPEIDGGIWYFSAVLGCGLFVAIWDSEWRYPAQSFYGFGLVMVGLAQLSRGFDPGLFFIWGSTSDLSGYLLVAALGGWVLRSPGPLDKRLPVPTKRHPGNVGWFHVSQAVLLAIVTGQALWIAWDFSFDGIGHGVALFGLSGRMAVCSATLMMLGGAILMAWQSVGRRRTVWQFTALASGLFFTSSIGWSQMSDSAGQSVSFQAWQQRALTVAVSASMLTVMTRWGLARFLPRHTDWIVTARRASPYFGMTAVTAVGIFILIQLLAKAAS